MNEKWKDWYKRFKQWQRNPFDYEWRSHDTQHCNNCGHDFKGNFCPYCSQRAGTGRITWKTTRQGVMLLWGMDSRSLPLTIVQLLLRPGYFIRDYISGRRQVSFPPVKALVIVALLVTIITKLFLPEKPAAEPLAYSETFDHFIEWLENHEDWGTLAICSIFILPTWLLFRKAPAYPKHTLPEGFFIQVFQCIQIVIVSFVVDDLLLLISLPFLLIYNYINYKQLFGYGIWGTIWRQVLMLIISFALFFLIFYLIAITMLLIDRM